MSCNCTYSASEHLTLQGNNQYESALNHSCDTGWEIVSGDQLRVCLHNKSWSGSHPVCDSRYPSLPSSHFTGIRCDLT